ncbi:MAG: acyltransferase [Bacteroidales bacterium]|jgi:acetyltransferase-like isoleucine patch superfamily enzyme|nr:acyltransferase [Bacteroidales bacterium]MDI9575701.1 acyltransferase [Bacteroidota bacterium]MDY0401733.1 acyltransferase [Bacteroidales bacterium]HHW59577.1 acyltransferase [Bacteroidales bacterium]
MSSFYTNEELSNLGLNKFGDKVFISRYAQFYSPETITIGNNVRIDDFCILSGNITLGSNIHISAYVALYGSKGIILENYTGISPRCTLFSAMDDFSGKYLIGPIHPRELTNVTGGKIILKQYSQIGAHCVIFPNVTIGEGSVVGTCSLITKSLDDWGIYAGIPAKWIKPRDTRIKNINY